MQSVDSSVLPQRMQTLVPDDRSCKRAFLLGSCFSRDWICRSSIRLRFRWILACWAGVGDANTETASGLVAQGDGGAADGETSAAASKAVAGLASAVAGVTLLIWGFALGGVMGFV